MANNGPGIPNLAREGRYGKIPGCSALDLSGKNSLTGVKISWSPFVQTFGLYVSGETEKMMEYLGTFSHAH